MIQLMLTLGLGGPALHLTTLHSCQSKNGRYISIGPKRAISVDLYSTANYFNTVFVGKRCWLSEHNCDISTLPWV